MRAAVRDDRIDVQYRDLLHFIEWRLRAAVRARNRVVLTCR